MMLDDLKELEAKADGASTANAWAAMHEKFNRLAVNLVRESLRGEGDFIILSRAPLEEDVERVARAIAANKRRLPTDDPEIGRVWNSYCGQARAAYAALNEGGR